MILLPKYKTVHPNGAIGQSIIGVSGEVRFVRRNCMGQVNYDSGWVPNRWLDQGMDTWATQSGGLFRTISLGDSNAAIVDTQDSLQGTHIGYSQGLGPGDGITNLGSTPNWESTYNRVFRTTPGQVVGTVREAVFTHVWAPAGSNANVRVLVSPEIIMAADETLDVYYKWTMWPPITDSDKEVVIDGLTYDTVSRIYDVNRTINVSPQSIPGYTIGSSVQTGAYGDGADLIAIDTNSGWGGAHDYGDTQTEFADAYINGNHYLDWHINIGLDGWVTGDGIRVIRINARSYNVQVKFTRQGGGGETVPKDNTQVVEDIYWRFGWARH